MDEKGVLSSPEEKNHSFNPTLFGVSCAFLALKLMPEISDKKWSENSDEKNVLQKQISELKKTRTEDAKANEKVVSIFATREQTWFHHRKNLRQQIAALTDKQNSLSEKLKETELLLQSKDKLIQELEGMRENAKQEHVSVLEHNQQLVSINQKLHKDLEHKDQILTAMMRKSKIDTLEKQMLIKEVKSSKAKRKQAEVEAAHWKAISEPKNEKNSLRNGELIRSKGDDHVSHQAIDAFVEQLKLKDEKMEAFCWRLTSMEIESNRLQSHIEGLNREIEMLRQDNVKLTKLHLSPPNHQKSNFNNTSPHDTVWSNVKVIKTKPTQEIEAIESPNEEIKEGQESNSTWKMDIQALGVSYKVKRFKQQLLMLEKFIGKKQSDENGKHKNGTKGLYAITSLLNKQIERYQSLEGKIDHLCIRMHEKKLDLKANINERAKDETKRMEDFLEEIFEIQRYMVATGQKLIDVQKKIASGFVGYGDDQEDIERDESFDFRRFGDSLKTLLLEVQRGLEVRISRIIGDLEGTLACDGFHLSIR